MSRYGKYQIEPTHETYNLNGIMPFNHSFYFHDHYLLGTDYVLLRKSVWMNELCLKISSLQSD